MNPKLRYQTNKSKRPQNIHELIARYERTASCYCRKYKRKYIQLNVKMGEESVHIFIIKYGRYANWKVLLTTDTAMHFVRAFELYERRWGIEVIFKECRGYLGLGKCQSRSYYAQIADTTLCFMMYQMLSLAKRFSEYETMGPCSGQSVTGCRCSPCGAGLWKKSDIYWRYCHMKLELTCWHVYQPLLHGKQQTSPQGFGRIYYAILTIMSCPIYAKHFLDVC